MNRVFFLITFSFLFIEVNSQSLKIDSLKCVLAYATGDERLDVLRLLIIEVASMDTHAAMPFANEAVKSIHQTNDSFRIVRAYRNKAQLLHEHLKYDSVMLLLEWPLAIARRHQMKEEVNRMLNLLGIANSLTARYGNALHYFYETLLLRRSISMETCTIYNNIGFSYYNLHENEKALTYFKKSYELYEKYDESIDPGLVLINIGLCFSEMKLYDSALHYINLGLRKSPRKNEIGGQFALGLLNYRQGKITASKMHFHRSLAVSRENCDARFICENQIFLARIHIELCEYNQAKEILDNVEAVLLTNKFDQVLLEDLKVFILLFKTTGDLQNLLKYNQKFIRLSEAIYSREAIQKIIAFQIELEQFENIQTLETQKKILGLQNASLQFQNKILYIASLGVVLTFIILVQIGYLVVKRKATFVILKTKVADRTEFFKVNLCIQDETKRTHGACISGICLRLSYLLNEIGKIQPVFGKHEMSYPALIYESVLELQKVNEKLRRRHSIETKSAK